MYSQKRTLGLLVFAGCVLFMAPVALQADPLAPEATSAESSGDFSHAIETVASSVGPAVVSIHTEKTEKVSARRQFYGSPFDDELFDKFFKDFFGEIPDREYKRSGLGSGGSDVGRRT